MADDMFVKMQKIARATEATVVVGCYSYRGDFFATASCGGVAEIQGSTPEDAVDSLLAIVRERIHDQGMEAMRTKGKTEAALRELATPARKSTSQQATEGTA